MKQIDPNSTMELKIHSIFESISGEAGGFPQGTWVTFIRLYGCNLQCIWCDTKQANDKELTEGEDAPYTVMSHQEITTECRTKNILITGGEPLYQKAALIRLIERLQSLGHNVQVETNGSIPLPRHSFVNPVRWVMDYKCPSSGMNDRMPNSAEWLATINDAVRAGGEVFIKYVVADGDDLDATIERISELKKLGYIGINIISPVDANGEMIEGMVEVIRVLHEDFLDDIIFSVQLHKLINMA